MDAVDGTNELNAQPYEKNAHEDLGLSEASAVDGVNSFGSVDVAASTLAADAVDETNAVDAGAADGTNGLYAQHYEKNAYDGDLGLFGTPAGVECEL